MPSSGVWGALGAFLQSAGQAAPKIAQDYNDEYERRDDRNRKRKKEDDAAAAKKSGGKKIQSAMTAIMNPMGVDEAKELLANTPPEEIKKAERVIAETGAAVLPGALPKQKQRWEQNKVKNAMRTAIAEQESGGNDAQKEHPRAANGLQAYGKFGIVPEYHIDKVGLNPKNAEHIKRWKADPALQEETFDRIIDENYKKAGGNVDKALEMYYGVAKDKDAPQFLADGRKMDSVNQYVAKVKSRMGDAANQAGMVKTAGKARQAIDNLVSEEFRPPSKARMRGQEKALGQLYMDLSPEEIEQNKDYLDRISTLATSGKEEYKDELTQYGNDLNRQTTAAINAMKLDEQMQMAMVKVRSGVKSLSAEEIRALESRRKMLTSMRDQITDFTTRVGSAKAGNRESILKTRPDMTSKESPGLVGRVFGAKDKTVIDDTRIQKKLDFIDEQLMETDRALAGLGGLDQSTDEEFEQDKNSMLSRPAGGGGIDPRYLKPVKK